VIITEARPAVPESVELLSRAREGDVEAFCAVAQASEQRLFQQAVALGHDPATAEDLVAETLIEAWKSIGRFDGSCRFSTWLYAILVHRHQKLARRRRSRPAPLSALPSGEVAAGELLLERLPDTRASPPEMLAQREEDERVRAAVHALPERHRRVVLLRFFEDASLPEIAAALGLSVGTVKSRLHHALAKLRKMKALVNLSSSPGDT
jgi:RNA polymerase sigma-70 factor (ECF subfamily)